MSKVGKLPVAIPAGVTITVADNCITVKGPKGELKQPVSSNIKADVQDGQLTLTTTNNTKQANADHGLYRALLANMVKGVSEGYSKSLIVNGVGYKCDVKGNQLIMNLGYSNDFIAIIPEGLTVTTDATGKLTVSGISKQAVGEFCAQIRKLRMPEPYKGKGIRYEDEVIRRKVGKTGVK